MSSPGLTIGQKFIAGNDEENTRETGKVYVCGRNIEGYLSVVLLMSTAGFGGPCVFRRLDRDLPLGGDEYSQSHDTNSDTPESKGKDGP